MGYLMICASKKHCTGAPLAQLAQILVLRQCASVGIYLRYIYPTTGDTGALRTSGASLEQICGRTALSKRWVAA